MVYRDPDTGLFRSGDDDVPEYRDYEFKHIRNSYTVDAADLPGAFPITESDISVIALDDLLDRDERADLVAIQVHSLQTSVPGTTSAEAALLCAFELRAGVGDELVVIQDGDYTVDDGSSGVVDADRYESDSPDVLFHSSWVAEGGFADSTNGLGGGPDQPVLDQDIHYPREYGSCPVFDDRDDITESFRLDDQGGADISDSLIRLDVAYTLVFSVHDRD